MNDPTAGNWGKSGNDPLGGSSSGRRRVAHGTGFDSYLQSLLNSAGGLQPRKGTTTAYKGGELDGMSQGEAEEYARNKYETMPDDQAGKYDPQPATPTYAGPTVGSPQPPASPSPYQGPTTSFAPSQKPSDYGANAQDPNSGYGPDAEKNLARLRQAGVVGSNETIENPEAFRAAVAKLSPQQANSTVPEVASAANGYTVKPSGTGLPTGGVDNSNVAKFGPAMTSPSAYAGPTVTPPASAPAAPIAQPAAQPVPPVASTPAPTPSTTDPLAVVDNQLSQAASITPAAQAASAQESQRVANNTPFHPGETGGGDPEGAVTQGDHNQFVANSAYAGGYRSPAIPIPGSGATDSSAGQYAGPTATPPSPTDDIDPATGKKRVTASM